DPSRCRSVFGSGGMRPGSRRGVLALEPVFQQYRDVRSTQKASPIGGHLWKDLRMHGSHPRPMSLRVPVVFLMIAVVEEYPVVGPVVRTHRVGEQIARLSAIVQEVSVCINQDPSQVI